MPRRKVSIPRLLLVILVLAIFAGLGTVAVKSILDRRIEVDTEPTPTPTAVSTSTPVTDFYVDNKATPTPSASAKADKDKMLKQEQAQTDKDKEKIANGNNTQSQNQNQNQDQNSTDVSGLSLQKSFGTINIRNGITITARANSGTVAVVLTDSTGKQTVAFKKNGPFNDVQNVTVPAGQYKLDLYSNAVGWNWSYSLY